MFELEGDSLVERFELVLLHVRTPFGTMDVPLVDGWIELQMALSRVPDHAERREFFAALGTLCASVLKKCPAARWYFLHKAPGLKLRFRVGRPDAALIELLISTVNGWAFTWMRASGLGSVFDQAELMPAAFRDDAERLLSCAADEHVAAVLADSTLSEEGWADFLVDLLCTVGLDEWLAHEALSRLRRLRAVPLRVEETAPDRLFDPSNLIARLPGPFSPGFAASVSLLQAINLILNMWAVDADPQRRILDRACARTRPSLIGASDG